MYVSTTWEDYVGEVCIAYSSKTIIIIVSINCSYF